MLGNMNIEERPQLDEQYLLDEIAFRAMLEAPIYVFDNYIDDVDDEEFRNTFIKLNEWLNPTTDKTWLKEFDEKFSKVFDIKK